MVFWGGGNRNRNTHPAVIVIAMIAAPIASLIIRMAISRTREFGADKTGAEISGNPLALASALEKIERYRSSEKKSWNRILNNNRMLS